MRDVSQIKGKGKSLPHGVGFGQGLCERCRPKGVVVRKCEGEKSRLGGTEKTPIKNKKMSLLHVRGGKQVQMLHKRYGRERGGKSVIETDCEPGVMLMKIRI